MADIKDDIGRIGKFQDAAIEKLSSMLTSAVGKAVKYAADQAKSFVSDKDYKDLQKALEDLGDDLKENLKSTRKFVSEVEEAAKSFEKAKQARRTSGSEGKGNFESIQKEQTKILGMILENQKKAQSAKIAKYTSGGSSLGSKAKLNLGDLGFKPKGTDKIPAMLSPGEFIVNRRGASRNSSLLDRINQGYRFGGIVKPKYFKVGGDTAPGPSGARPVDSLDAWNKATKYHAEVVIDKVEIDAAAAAEAKKVGKELTEYINEGFKSGSNKEIASWLTGMSTALMGGKADLLQSIFTGSVTDAMDFQREMRLIAFQTQGITGDFRDMQGNFSDLGKVAAETGKSISVMQRVYMSNLKKGFKDNKEGMKVMKSGLFLSTMIGSEAQQTADLFGDWHRTLALSSGEMSQLARSMRSVALSTGVTGDELLGAMKSSEGILKNLRNQGNLTAGVSKSVIEMMAESKKFGFEDSANKYLTAMSSHSKMMDADSSTKSLLFSVANTMGPEASQQMLMGTFMKDRSNLEGFSKGLKERVGSLIGISGKDLDFSKLSQGEKDLLALRLRSLGIEMAEAENLIKVTEKASKGLSGTLEELEKTASSDFSTEAEKQLANKQKDEALLNHSLSYLSAIGEQAKDKNLSDALKDSYSSADFKDKKQDFAALGKYLTEDMKSAYGIGGTAEQMSQQLASLDPSKAAELNALVLGDQLGKMAKERGISLDRDYSSEIKSALASGDNAKFRELVAEAEKKAGEIAVDQQASTSPEEKLALEINKLNETMRAYTSSFVRGMVDYIGWMGLLAVQIGLLSTALYATFGKGLLDFTGVMGSLFPKGGIKGLFSKGGKLAPEGGLKGLISRTDELGDVMKGKIVGSVEELGEKGFKFFNTASDGITNMHSAFVKGYKRSKAAGGGFWKSMSRGFSGLGKSNKMTRGLTNSIEGLHSIFQKGFSRSIAAGGGFWKSMARGFSGLAKSNKVTREILGTFTKGLTKVKTMGLDAFGFIRKNVGFVDAFAKGFTRARVAGQGLIGSLIRGFSGARKSIGLGRNLSKLFSGGFAGVISGARKILTGGFAGLVKGAKTVFSGGFAGLLKGVATGFKGGMRLAAGGLRAAILGGTLGTAQIIFSAIDMVFGAVSGFTNTGKNFEGVMKAMGKSTKDMTWGMYASSTVAGALVGILDGLTFGMLSLTGATEWLNQTLSLVFYTVFSVIEGLIEGIMVPFEAVWSAFKYIGDQFKSIGDSLLGVFNSIAGLFGPEAGNWSEAFAMIYPWLKGIGKVIGTIVGMPLAGLLWLVVKAISALLVPIQMFINAIAGVFKIFSAVITFFKDIFQGNIRKAFRNLGSTVLSAVYGVFKPIVDFLWSIGKDLFAPIKKFFGGIPKGIYDWIYGAAGKIGAQWLMDMLFGKKSSTASADASKGKTEVAQQQLNQGFANPDARFGANTTPKPSLRAEMERTYGSDAAARATAGVPSSVERASASVSTPVGHHAVPVARPNEEADVGSVQPVHLRDITGSILRDKAGTSGTGRVQSDELSRIEEASFRQVDELEQIRQGISEMVALLKPKGSGVVGGAEEAGSGNTKDPRRPLHAARFGKMKYGKVGGNANRSLVNNGES